MNKSIFILCLSLITTFSFAQTSNDNLNASLEQMKSYFLAEDYGSFANYTYPKLIEMAGGKTNMVNATEQAMSAMKNQGFSFLELDFIEPSAFFNTEDETQCTLRQVITMNTPQGKVRSEYTIIAISGDEGENWTFLDTSGKDKATMTQYFPNLHADLPILPKKQEFID